MDRSIPYYNIIMRCDTPPAAPAATPLPQGYCLRPYTPGRERDWAALEYAIGDFPSGEEALQYFRSTYLHDVPALEARCAFIIEESTGSAVAACTAWREGDAPVSSLHWLVAHPAHQGRGLGRAMLSHTLGMYAALDEYPVYLHTQPWSYKAIWLYHQAGFRLCRADTFAHYTNDYAEAINVLESLLTPAQHAALRERAV